MRFSASMILASVAALAIAAPVEQPKRQVLDLATLLAGNNGFNQGFDSSLLFNNFQQNNFQLNDLLVLLQGFDINGFNQQFNGAFNQQQVAALLISLEGNQFGNSNLQFLGNNDLFNLNSFAGDFNGAFGANWQVAQIQALLLQLGLVNQNAFGANVFNNVFGGVNAFNNVGVNAFSNVGALSSASIVI